MIPFTKMHGIGNDFVLVDAIRRPLDGSDLSELARRICDRKLGIGADGLILVENGGSAPFRMRMFNPDGSEGEMCGNGVRCIALFLRDEGHTRAEEIPLETGAGTLSLQVLGDGKVRVDMGRAGLTRGDVGMDGDPSERFINEPMEAAGYEIRGTAVSMGNPHLIAFVEDARSWPLDEAGPAFERHHLFPRRTNVHFVQVLDRRTLVQRTWERGAGATLACGTGACASTVAAWLNGLAERSTTVRLPGGELEIEYAEDGTVWMTGPAATVFSGVWPG